MKKYKCGLYIGRFQPLHVGHTHVIAKMLMECEKVVIAVGSTQEYGTKRNPFSFAQRKCFIERCFPYYIHHTYIVPLRDREKVSNDASWGDYVFENIKKLYDLTPDVIYEGEETERTTWYDNLDVDIIKVPRTTIPISATEVREGIINNDEEIIFRYIPYGIRDLVNEMREVILKCKD